MKKFLVSIKETLERVVEVEADNYQDAVSEVKEKYANEEIVLDSEDYVDTDIDVVWED